MAMQADRIDLPGGTGVADFVPVAYYDKHMDCIRVFTHDRSVTEVRIDRTFTLHRCNRPSPMDPKYVGFTIKGVQHIFNEVGLPKDRVIRLAEIIDAMVKHHPGSAVSAVADLIFSGYQSAGDLRVDLSEVDEGNEREAA
jgi:hypothetical protein